MSSPLFKALTEHINRRRARFYMPGHKGELPFPLDGCAPFDVTEVPDTGCLYDGEGAPVLVEREFSKLYQSGATLLSTGGSTLCIQTMLSLFCPVGSTVIMTRNAHHAAVNAAALLDLNSHWLIPDEPSGVLTPGRITPAAVEKAIKSAGDASAVYITSPDYFGTLCDVALISKVCHDNGLPLLIDNAHGAHLKFFSGLHPIEAGADACCDSLHKTMPALTGAALLHLKEGSLKSEARRRMKHFGSTSPSYLIMLSADLILPRWGEIGKGYINLAKKVQKVKTLAKQKGVWALDDSPLRDPARIALLYPEGENETVKKLLYSLDIEAEYISPRHIVLLPSPQSDLSVVEKLINALSDLSEDTALLPFVLPERKLSLRQAALFEAEEVCVKNSLGRISAVPCAPCPPGTALIMPGEVIDEGVLANLEQYGVDKLFVVKK